MMRTVFDAPERFKETYFVQFPGNYFTGDRARKDEDGYFWFLGRVDDVIHSSGYRLGTQEIENALVSHEAVAEALLFHSPSHERAGHICLCDVKAGVEKSEELKKVLLGHVLKKIGSIAVPDKIQFVDVLSKTLSGKIMRRILRKIAAGDIQNLGDASALANPSVVEEFDQRKAVGIAAMAKTGIVKHPLYLEHKTGIMHPENPYRLESIYTMLESRDFGGALVDIPPRFAKLCGAPSCSRSTLCGPGARQR